MKKKLLMILTMVALTLVPMSAYAKDEVVYSGVQQTYDVQLNLPSKNYTGIVPGYDGNYYLVQNGKVLNYTGIYCDPIYGCWLIGNGVVCLNYNDFFNDPVVGWWKITGGAVDFAYTGWYTSPTVGTWYVQGGQLDFSKGQKAETTTVNYNDGYSDNTYGTYKATISNEREADAAIIGAILQHSLRLEATCVGGYTGDQLLERFKVLYQSWNYEATVYDIATVSTYWASAAGSWAAITMEYWDTVAEEQYLDQLADSMKKTLAGKSDYEKVVYIHDYLCKACNYDYTYSHYSPYSCVATGTSVCQGYAMAFMKLAEACGVQVRYLASDDHAYNAVCLNGNWYLVDVTWDDGVNSKRYFLKGINGLRSVGYNYTNWFTSGVYSINLAQDDYR